MRKARQVALTRKPKRQRKAETVYSRLSEKAKQKVIARSIANVEQKRGNLVPEPCEICGTTEDIEKHHPDYRFPKLVTWLCRKHHLDLHHPLRRAA